MMPGMIMLWYGAVVDIPSGWALCDGNNNTPNLLDKFVFGAGWHYDPGDTGGSTSHQHPFTGDGHAHDLASGNKVLNSDPAGDFDHYTSTVPASGDTDTANHMPPYVALCFIMKLPIP